MFSGKQPRTAKIQMVASSGDGRDVCNLSINTAKEPRKGGNIPKPRQLEEPGS
jgi:hypothetical protein